MSVNNIQHRFEQLIDSLSIKEGKKKYLRNQVNYIKQRLKKVSKWTFDNPQNSIQSMSNNIEIVRFWYGGSWDRGVHINKEFDIDIYIIYDEIDNSEYDFNENTLNGEILFTILFDDLDTIQEEVDPNLEIMEPPSYSHAIPIRLQYQSRILKVDCIPAIELPNQYLLVPDGWNYIKKVNQKLEENGLSKVNKKRNGNATKIIWLLKYWNWYWNKPLKSYVIQRIGEDIFIEFGINNWDKAVKTFFHKAINVFNKYNDGILVLQDRIYTNKSILEDYSEKKIDQFYDTLQEANQYAIKNQWDEIFGDF